MARIAKKTTSRPTKKSAARSGKSAETAKAAAKPAAGRRPAAAAPKPSKEDMRLQLEKLERSNTTLRAKNREIVKQAKAATATVAELEQKVAQLEAELAARALPAAKVEPAKLRRPRKPRDTGSLTQPPTAVADTAESASGHPADAEDEWPTGHHEDN